MTVSHVPHYIALKIPSCSQAILLFPLVYFCSDGYALGPALCLPPFLPNGGAQAWGACGRMPLNCPSGELRYRSGRAVVQAWIQSMLPLLEVCSKVGEETCSL